MIAVDWSHTKELTTYDGRKVRIESLKQLLGRLRKDGESREPFQSTKEVQPSKAGGESNLLIQSSIPLQPPALIFESGVPLSIAYRCILAGAQIFQLDNKAVAEYREAEGIEKTDENDAKIIYHLANNGAKLMPLTLDNKLMQLHDLYHQYRRYQKARVAMQNMKKAHHRQYRAWGGESKSTVKSLVLVHPPLDLLPYDIAIDTLEAREKSLIKRIETEYKGLPLFEIVGGESTPNLQSILVIQPPAIKGLGKRLWMGILITANPNNFKCLSAYLRYCGLTSDVITSHKYNRHARMLYHLLAEEVMKQRDPHFRPIYDKIKEELKFKYPDYTKGHIHNAALNRTATFLAKEIYSINLKRS